MQSYKGMLGTHHLNTMSGPLSKPGEQQRLNTESDILFNKQQPIV